MEDGRFRLCVEDTLQHIAGLVVGYPAHDSMQARKFLFTGEAERKLYSFSEALNDNRTQAEEKVPDWRRETIDYLLSLLSSIKLKDNASDILDACLEEFLHEVRDILSRGIMFKSS